MNANNVKLKQVLEAMYQHRRESENDARQVARALGAAKADAQTVGAEAKLSSDHDEIMARHAKAVAEIAYLIVGMAMGGGGGGGGASPLPKGLQALLKGSGPVGAMLQAVLEGAMKGDFEAAVQGVVQVAGEWVKSNSGLASSLISAAEGKTPDLGDSVGNALGSRALDELVVTADRSEEADAVLHLAESLGEAEAQAKARRAKAQVERMEVERAILGLQDVAALA